LDSFVISDFGFRGFLNVFGLRRLSGFGFLNPFRPSNVFVSLLFSKMTIDYILSDKVPLLYKKKEVKNGHPGAIRLDHTIFSRSFAHFHIRVRAVAIPLAIGHVPTGADHRVQQGKQLSN
jgi:hypothetical protein